MAELPVMYTAGLAIEISGLIYRELDNLVRDHGVVPSGAPAQGSGTRRRFTERDLVALTLTKNWLAAGQRIQPFLHVVRHVQRGRGLPPLNELEGKILLSDGSTVRVVDADALGICAALKGHRVLYVIDIGAAARHVRERIAALAKNKD